ncbi:hypothetical protein ACFRU3_09875 [Streptomyces sp. NPDC056910]|uniref:hypothetical protein n=1 Tax=Streptomyces sp. NPDC056910 TaxID=3345964 RepID=UPI00367BB599
MFTTLMPGFRDLRAALVAGGLLLGCVYILIGDRLPHASTLRTQLRAIAHLNSAMPTVLAVLGCVLVGSLYTTALEGLVDWLHRRLLHVDVAAIGSPLKRRLFTALVPFSVASRSRLITEAGRLYDQTGPSSSSVTRTAFQDQVLADVLWLEGKLVGTALKDPHDQYRSEGELRLATGLLLPLCTATMLYGVRAHVLWLVLAVFVGAALGMWQVNYGLYYYRRANSFLAHHIADGTLKTPSMESLH